MRISDWSSDVCSSDLPAGVLRREVELQPAEEAMGLGRGERLVERGPGVCVDRLSLTTLILSASGKSTLTRSRIRSAKSAAVRRWATVTLRQGRWASRVTNRLTVPLGYNRSRRVPAVPAREGSADALRR